MANMQAAGEFVDRARWSAIVRRVADQDVEKMHRRRDVRYFVCDGIAFLTRERSTRGPGTSASPAGSTTARAPTSHAEISVTLLQVSQDGVMVRSFEQFAYETRVSLRACIGDVQVRLHGHVMHCTETLGGYKVGIELQF